MTFPERFFARYFEAAYGFSEKNGFSVEVLNGIKLPKGRPVIFVLTHIGKWDFEIVNEQIKE